MDGMKKTKNENLEKKNGETIPAHLPNGKSERASKKY